jgi:fucose 4-O-acetylase-like acetyltransferase
MRNYKIDNIKAFLIILVVFGHMLELVNMGGLYRLIYTIHMPVFVFVSGYFAKFNAKKIVTNAYNIRYWAKYIDDLSATWVY